MQEYLKKYAKHSIVNSIVVVILALFLIFKPIQSLNFVVILIGVVLLLNGIRHAISYFSTSNEYRSMSFELLQSIIYVIPGLIFIFNPGVINDFVNYIIGIWLIIESVFKLQISLNLKSMENEKWKSSLIIPIITAILGIIIIFTPFSVVATALTITGILLLISQIVSLVEMRYIFKL